MHRRYMCSSHTISGVMPGGAARHGLEARLAACAAAGYDGLWLHHRDYAALRAAGASDASIRALFDRYGLAERGVEFLTDWFLEDDAVARAAERDAFDAAAAIGARLVNVGGDFSGRGIGRDEMLSRFDLLCGRAAARGLTVALEFVPWSNVPDIRAALPFLEPPNAGIVLDCWHLFRGGTPLADIALVPPGRVACVQVSDAAAAPDGTLAEDTLRRLPCGQGALDLAGFAATLDACAIDAPLSIEIISPEIAAMPADAAARLTLDTARAVFDPA